MPAHDDVNQRVTGACDATIDVAQRFEFSDKRETPHDDQSPPAPAMPRDVANACKLLIALILLHATYGLGSCSSTARQKSAASVVDRLRGFSSSSPAAALLCR